MNQILTNLSSLALLGGGVYVVWRGEKKFRRPRKKKSGPRIQIGGVPIPQSLEPLHFLIAGSTGTGKTQAIAGLLDTIRARGDRVILADAGGGVMSRWYRAGDTILSAMDSRSVRWSPFAEMETAADADRIAKSMIPDSQGNDREWQLYSQGLVSAVLERLWTTGSATNQSLVHSLTVAKADELESMVAGLPAQTLFDTGAAKMLSSVRGIIGSYLPPYRFLPRAAGRDSWSIRKWVREGDGWLWLPYRDDQRAAVSPLIAAWLGEAVAAILSLPPSHTRKIWLILDEIASLGRIQALDDALVRGRKYGLRAVLGLQSIAQLRQSYGRDGAQILLSCLSSSLVLRAADAETSDAMSRLLGEQQVRREHSSHGPSGSSKAEHISIERVVLPSEIQSLPDLTGYLSLAGDYPIARVSIPIVDRAPVVPAHVPVEPGGAVHAPEPAVPGGPGSAGKKKRRAPPRADEGMAAVEASLSPEDREELKKMVAVIEGKAPPSQVKEKR